LQVGRVTSVRAELGMRIGVSRDIGTAAPKPHRFRGRGALMRADSFG